MAGILAAALSSIDSALNSLSAVTLEEFLPGLGRGESRWSLVGARALTVAWGAWATATGLWFSRAGETVIEVINRVGSVFYGPILALFVLAWRSRRADQASAVAGALTGVGVNLALWWFAPGVSWLWWNVTGFLTTWVVGELAGRRADAPPRGATAVGSVRAEPAAGERLPRLLAGIMVGEFVAILLGLGALTLMLG